MKAAENRPEITIPEHPVIVDACRITKKSTIL